MTIGRKPTHWVTVKDKPPGKGVTRIGSAWAEEDGSIGITLGPCVVLTSESNVTIKLWPANSTPKNKDTLKEDDPPFR